MQDRQPGRADSRDVKTQSPRAMPPAMQTFEQAEQVVDALAQQRAADMQREESFPGVTVAPVSLRSGVVGGAVAPMPRKSASTTRRPLCARLHSRSALGQLAWRDRHQPSARSEPRESGESGTSSTAGISDPRLGFDHEVSRVDSHAGTVSLTTDIAARRVPSGQPQ